MGDVLKIALSGWADEFYRALALEATYRTVLKWHPDWSRHRFFHWVYRAALEWELDHLMRGLYRA